MALVASTNEGWLVESIVTLLNDAKNNTIVLTRDFHINRWLDGNEEQQKCFDLTLAIWNYMDEKT